MANEIKLEVNGIQLNVEDSQTGKDTIVFIHPFPFNKSIWSNQIDSLKDKFRVISYDIRGFGKSTMDNKKSSIGLFADDLIQLLDLLKVEKVIACGLSMGGYILLDAVERYPGKFKAIVLSDTQCIADSKDEQQIRYDTIKDIEENGLTAFTDKFITKALSQNSQKNQPGLTEHLKSIINSTSREAVCSGLSAMAQRNEACSKLQDIKVPCLVISGKEDIVIRPSQSEFLFGHINGAQLKIIEDAGHLANAEQPNAFNEILETFVKDLKPIQQQF